MHKKALALLLILCLMLTLLPAAAGADAAKGLFAGKYRAGAQIFDCQRGWETPYTEYYAHTFVHPYAHRSPDTPFTDSELANRYFQFKKTSGTMSAGAATVPVVELYLLNDDGSPVSISGKTTAAGLVNQGRIEAVADEGVVYVSNDGLGYIVTNTAGYAYNSFSDGTRLILHTNLVRNPALSQLEGFNASTTPLDAGDVLVSFQANGGVPAPAAQSVTIGQKVSAPPAIHKNGSFFAAWYTNASFTGAAWDFSTDTVTGPVTLYALWDAIPPSGPPAATPDANASAVDIPKTGDNGTPALWAVLFLLSCAGLRLVRKRRA